MSDANRAAIVGEYAFGSGATERLTVENSARGLVVKREGGVERNLFHWGERTFHSSAAPDVRIRFASGVTAETITIEDGSLVVAGRRIRR